MMREVVLPCMEALVNQWGGDADLDWRVRLSSAFKSRKNVQIGCPFTPLFDHSVEITLNLIN